MSEKIKVRCILKRCEEKGGVIFQEIVSSSIKDLDMEVNQLRCLFCNQWMEIGFIEVENSYIPNRKNKMIGVKHDCPMIEKGIIDFFIADLGLYFQLIEPIMDDMAHSIEIKNIRKTYCDVLSLLCGDCSYVKEGRIPSSKECLDCQIEYFNLPIKRDMTADFLRKNVTEENLMILTEESNLYKGFKGVCFHCGKDFKTHLPIILWKDNKCIEFHYRCLMKPNSWTEFEKVMDDFSYDLEGLYG